MLAPVRGRTFAYAAIAVGALGCSASSKIASTGDAGDMEEGPEEVPDETDADASYPALKLSSISTPVLISDAFFFTEGPVWDPAAGVLYFTDINAHQRVADDGMSSAADAAVDAGTAGDSGPDTDGGTAASSPRVSVGGAIYRLTPPSAIELFLEPIGNADGLGLDPDGKIIAAGFVARNAWRLSEANTMDTLAPCASGSASCYMDQELNTPDDITARSDGTLYITDPTFGSGGQGFPAQTLPLSGAQGVYRLTTDGTLSLEDQSTQGPNGVNLSPDEKTLYVSYSVTGQVAKFDVAEDGSLSNKTVFVTGALSADSMCVDAGGNLYVGTLGGLSVYDGQGSPLGTIQVGGRIVTNCAFGGDDQTTLFITARSFATLLGAPRLGGSSLYQIADMPIPGIPGQN